ncbi:MAG: type 2 lanthipeptide synthetase LanM family protein [Terriglobales bacterium]
MKIDDILGDSRWYLATTMDERIHALKFHNDPDPNRPPDNWSPHPPFERQSLFAQRLTQSGLTPTEFRSLAGGSAREICALFPSPPEWLAGLQAAFQMQSIPGEDAWLEENRSNADPAATVIAPLVRYARCLLRDRTSAIKDEVGNLTLDAATAGALLEPGLRSRLAICTRALVLELNIARLRGRLRGESPEARFSYFAQQMARPRRALRFLLEYPVLARLLVQCVHQWVSASTEFFERLCCDWQSILTTFCSGNNPGALTAVDTGVGDCHESGRSVAILTFSSGFRLVYKPRPLAVDVHFQYLLLWLNERGLDPTLRQLRILSRSNYGWTEFVAQQECHSREEVTRFYTRQGSYLAILYVLGARDFHYENLIAEGEHPVLLDLEGVLHARLREVTGTGADDLARSTLLYSVLGVGMLPWRIGSSRESDGIDLSGIGGKGGQRMPFTLPTWSNSGTDEMQLQRQHLVDPGSQNRPSLEGVEVDVATYSDSIVSGFSNTYRLMSELRSALVSPDGPLACFAGDEVRVIFRPTKSYAMLLYESYHPDALCNAAERDFMFDRLWVKALENPQLAAIIPYEKRDLWNGDVPKFTSKPGSRDLSAASRQRIPSFLDEPSIQSAMRRVEQLSEDDLARQLWVIRASLSTLAAGPQLTSTRVQARDEDVTSVSQQELVDVALAVGDRLHSLAIRGSDDASWIGVRAEDHRSCSLTPLALDLYEGLPGVILFLAFLGGLTKQERYTELARAGLRSLRRQLPTNRDRMASIGAFTGRGGLVYALTLLGVLWGDVKLLSEAEEMVASSVPLIAEDTQFDLIGGAAGLIAGLLVLHRSTSSEMALAAAIACGNHLAAHAVRIADEMAGWRPTGESGTPLTGFSHGAGGVAWALLNLSAATGESRFRNLAADAIRYERSLFSDEAGNWPDLRTSDARLTPEGSLGRFVVAWCHGAPGIGMARLASLPYMDDPQTRSEIDTAIHTTMLRGFGGNHSLCHGDLGNLELLIQASEKFNEMEIRKHRDREAAQIVRNIRRSGWSCGPPSGVESPGLMTGLAGIGYQLLRLAEPAQIPSVLLLEPLDQARAMAIAA